MDEILSVLDREYGPQADAVRNPRGATVIRNLFRCRKEQNDDVSGYNGRKSGPSG